MSAANPRLPIHAATGTELSARSWQTEAPLHRDPQRPRVDAKRLVARYSVEEVGGWV